MTDSTKWTSTKVLLPPNGELVKTKTSDKETNLIREHNLWFLPCRTMYIYYTPEYWRPIK